jgi:hypothetical protein
MFPNLTVRSYDNVADVVASKGGPAPSTALTTETTDIIDAKTVPGTTVCRR